MNCYQSESDIGDNLGLCNTCKTQRDPGPLPSPVIVEESVEVLAVNSFLFGWPGKIILCLILYTIAFVFIHNNDPRLRTTIVAIESLRVIFSFASTFGWLLMWMELFMESLVLGLIAIPFPPLVYRAVITYPERMMKPFILHIGSVFAVLLLGFWSASLR